MGISCNIMLFFKHARFVYIEMLNNSAVVLTPCSLYCADHTPITVRNEMFCSISNSSEHDTVDGDSGSPFVVGGRSCLYILDVRFIGDYVSMCIICLFVTSTTHKTSLNSKDNYCIN